MKNLVLLLFILFPLFSVSQNQIVLKSGKIYNGTVNSFLGESLIFDHEIGSAGSNEISISAVSHILGKIPAYRMKAILKKNPTIIFSKNLLRIVHAYEGAIRSEEELVYVKVEVPATIFFIDNVPIKINGGEILALLPGSHSLITGCPIKSSTGNEYADHFAKLLSENKEITISGKPGGYYKIIGKDDGMTAQVTINNRTFIIPKTYHVKLDTINDQNAISSFLPGNYSIINVPLHIPFLNKPANVSELQKLQGLWTVVGVNIEGKEYTVDEYKLSAKSKGGDTTLLNIKIEIDSVRIKWKGAKIRGETIIVEIDSEKVPKTMEQISVGNGEDVTYAIYEINGNTMKYCFGSIPPKSFDLISDKKGSFINLILQRQDVNIR
jgi:uncharacterized protein (TIGR03067 family)